MGAWGHGSFDNDTAMDWTWDLEASSDFSVITQALDRISAQLNDYLEAPDCDEALAAAEVIAALKGHPVNNLPQNVTQWLAGKPQPDDELIAKCKNAIQAIRDKSELKDLWQETDDFDVWSQSVNDLLARLS